MNKTVFTATLHFPLIHIAHFHDFIPHRIHFRSILCKVSLSFVLLRQQLSQVKVGRSEFNTSLTYSVCMTSQCGPRPVTMTTRVLDNSLVKKIFQICFIFIDLHHYKRVTKRYYGQCHIDYR